jgi:hypothetical protein
LVTQNAANAAPDPTLIKKQGTMFSSLMDNANSALPADSTLTSVMGQSPTGYSGRSTLASMSARNPFSGTYENTTADAFKQRASDALAQVASGPEAVRGGSARTGIAQGVMATRLGQERGHEIRAAQTAEAPLVLGATNAMTQAEQARTGQSLQAAQGLNMSRLQQQNMGLQAGRAIDVNKLNNLQLLQLASSLQGTTKDVQTDDFAGTGNQSQNMMYGGVDCCFIFLQGLNGKLPWYIELARYDYYTTQRKRGYKWMSRWLVPRMIRSRAWTTLVNVVIVKPFLAYGAWLYKDYTASWRGRVAKPYCKAWLALWNTIGRFVK